MAENRFDRDGSSMDEALIGGEKNPEDRIPPTVLCIFRQGGHTGIITSHQWARRDLINNYSIQESIMSPRVSIVIPTWNRRVLLAETLESIRCQDESAWECLVVDDSSTDDTAPYVEGIARVDPRIRLVPKAPGSPRGPASSRNQGRKEAAGRYVLFFDSDDLLPPGFLRRVLDRLDREGGDCLVCRIAFFGDSPSRPERVSPPLEAEGFLGRAIAGEQDLFCQNVVWRRSFLDAMDGFREDLTMVEDLEFAVRALVREPSLLLENDLQVLVRRHPESLTFDPNPERSVQRDLHMYDAYDAIVSTLRKSSSTSPVARTYCAKRRYDLLVGLLKQGRPSLPLARRYPHLLFCSLGEGETRSIIRLSVLAPIFWTWGFALFLNNRAKGSR